MSIINPQGPHNQGPTGPVTRGEEIVGDIVVGTMVTALASFGVVLACGFIAFGASSAVQFAMEETGMLAAWVAQASAAAGEPLTITAIGWSIVNNLAFGALVGLILGLVQFVRRWRKERHRWLVEAVISPSSLAALSYGVASVALHVLISALAAWAMGALFGVFLPSPAALIGGDGGLLLHDFIGGGGDGGAPPDFAQVLLRLLFLVFFVVLIAAALACNLFAAVSWVLFRFAPWTSLGSAAGEGAVGSVAHGLGVLGAGVVIRLAITRFGLKKDGWPTSRPYALSHLREGGTGFAHAFVSAAFTGAVHSAIYAIIVLALPVAFGIAA